MVYSIAYNVLGSHADAEDAAQDAFLRCYRSLPQYRSEASFSTWLFRVALTTAARSPPARAAPAGAGGDAAMSSTTRTDRRRRAMSTRRRSSAPSATFPRTTARRPCCATSTACRTRRSPSSRDGRSARSRSWSTAARACAAGCRRSRAANGRPDGLRRRARPHQPLHRRRARLRRDRRVPAAPRLLRRTARSSSASSGTCAAPWRRGAGCALAPPPGFADRVMAAVEREPLPAPRGRSPSVVDEALDRLDRTLGRVPTARRPDDPRQEPDRLGARVAAVVIGSSVATAARSPR